VPTAEEEWDVIAKELKEKLDVCSTIRAMDRKHNFVRCPQLIGSYCLIINMKTISFCVPL
jgi:hypothetical protein